MRHRVGIVEARLQHVRSGHEHAGEDRLQRGQHAPRVDRRERGDGQVVLHPADVDVVRLHLAAGVRERERLGDHDPVRRTLQAQHLGEREGAAGPARGQDHDLARTHERRAGPREGLLGERRDRDAPGCPRPRRPRGRPWWSPAAGTVCSPSTPVRRRTPASRIGARTASKRGRSNSVHGTPRLARSAAVVQPPLPAPRIDTFACISLRSPPAPTTRVFGHRPGPSTRR